MAVHQHNILALENLSKWYKKDSNEIRALDGISFTVAEGEFISIVGKSGSGKSTLLNLIGGLDRPSTGRILFKDIGLQSMNRKQLAYHRKHSIGLVFQSFNLIPSRNAVENITLALAFGGIPRNERFTRAVSLLDRVSLSDRIFHKPSELSGGESQRVAIARAIANDPDILLADEPTGNLDSQTSEEIMTIIHGLNAVQGKTVVMVTHDLETALRYSHRIIRLKDGRIDQIMVNEQHALDTENEKPENHVDI